VLTRPAGEGLEDHFLHFHGALHSARGIGHGALLGLYPFHTAQQERSFHGSLESGHFTYL